MKIENEYSPTFETKTGVGQGDIALDGSLKELKKLNCGITIGQKINVLAFTDDIVLLGDTKRN